MSLRDLRGRHLWLIWTNAIKYSLRSGSGIVFALIALFVGLFIANSFFSTAERARATLSKETGTELTQKQVMDEIVKSVGKPAAKWALGDDERFSDHLLFTNPPLLSTIYLVLLFSVPLLIPMGAFNQVSGDIQTKGLRYLLTRSERANIFFGRFLGTYFFCCAIMIILVVTISAYSVAKGSDVSGQGGALLRAYFSAYGDVLPLTFWATVGLLMLSLPYVALCAWMSASIASPFLSLLASSFIVISVPIGAKILALTYKPLEHVVWAIPWPFKFNFLHPEALVKTEAIGLCLLYTAIFLALGYRKFSRRDL